MPLPEQRSSQCMVSCTTSRRRCASGCSSTDHEQRHARTIDHPEREGLLVLLGIARVQAAARVQRRASAQFGEFTRLADDDPDPVVLIGARVRPRQAGAAPGEDRFVDRELFFVDRQLGGGREARRTTRGKQQSAHSTTATSRRQPLRRTHESPRPPSHMPCARVKSGYWAGPSATDPLINRELTSN